MALVPIANRIGTRYNFPYENLADLVRWQLQARYLR